MAVVHRSLLFLLAMAVVCGMSAAETHVIDDRLPGGGDCSLLGVWDASTGTCQIESARIEDGEIFRIESGILEVAGTLTNEGTLDNRGTIIVNGFLNSTNDLVNFWDGTMVVRGQLFSHFMYNFGGLTNEPTGTIEFELHLENNAPLLNQGHIDIVGNVFNITHQRIDNLGTLSIASTGHLNNGGRFLHAGRIDNAGMLTNGAELIEHCDSVFAGIPAQGLPSTGAQSLLVGPVSLEWCPISGANGYDVVEGDLHLLRSSGGDFSAATNRCAGNDLVLLSLEHESDLESGQGLWFLVRANNVPSADFDTVFSSQVGLRVDEIAAAPGACP